MRPIFSRLPQGQVLVVQEDVAEAHGPARGTRVCKAKNELAPDLALIVCASFSRIQSNMVAKRVNAYNIRYGLTKVAQFWALGVAVAYYFRHRRGDWTRQEGWKVYRSKTPTYPGKTETPIYLSMPRLCFLHL